MQWQGFPPSPPTPLNPQARMVIEIGFLRDGDLSCYGGPRRAILIRRERDFCVKGGAESEWASPVLEEVLHIAIQLLQL